MPSVWLENMNRKKLNGLSSLPWVFEQEHFESLKPKIIYVAVGGAAYSHLVQENREKLKILKKANYLSVRENASKRNLKNLGLKNVNIAPDSAFLVSAFFPKQELMELARQRFKIKEKYIVFQISKNLSKGNISEILKQFSLFMNVHKEYQVILLPIGHAALHEYITALNKIQKVLLSKGFENQVILVRENTIIETIEIIAYASLFIGMSLYGNIMALSYAVLCIGLDSRVTKICEVMRDFSVPSQLFGVEYKDIYDSIEKMLISDRDVLELNSERLKHLVSQNFDRIADLLK